MEPATTASNIDINTLVEQAARAQAQAQLHDTLVTIAVVIGIVLVLLYIAYVRLIAKKNKVREALASIDVQLKERYDLIPNILFIANKFMEHERGLLDDITKLRTEAVKMTSDLNNVKEKIALDAEIKNKMGQLMVSVENYPQLKSDQTMIQAMSTYNEVEEHIAAARRFYNSAVLELNNAVETVPTKWFAESLGIKSELPYFEITNEKERESIDAKAYFS